MHRFTRKKIIKQSLRDFGFGLGLFAAIISMATIDARRAWPASDIIQHVENKGPNARSVDKLNGHHNLAAFIRNSLITDYTQLSTTTRAVQAPNATSRKNRMHFYAANMLHYTLIAFMFASMFTLTFGFWRYLRREYASPRRTKWRRG